MNTHTSNEEYSAPSVTVIGSIAELTQVQRPIGSIDWKTPR